MKTDTIYSFPRFGSLVYIISIENDYITFSAATYLSDLFTTKSQYEVREAELNENQFLELTKENYEVFTVYKRLGNDLVVRAEGDGKSYEFTTELKLQPNKSIVDIKERLELFKDWKYANIS